MFQIYLMPPCRFRYAWRVSYKIYLYCNTHRIFRLQVSYFGISAASLIFQEVIDEVMKGISKVAVSPGRHKIIGGRDKKDYDHAFRQAKQRLKMYNFAMNE